jgi:hypothetical protein
MLVSINREAPYTLVSVSSQVPKSRPHHTLSEKKYSVDQSKAASSTITVVPSRSWVEEAGQYRFLRGVPSRQHLAREP